MSDGGRRSTRTETELALIQQGPLTAAAILAVLLVLTPALAPAVAVARVAAAAVFAAAGWLAVRTRGVAAVGVVLFLALLAVCVAASLWQFAGDPVLPATISSAAALALFLLWSVAHLVAPVLPRDPAFEVLGRVEAARAFAATMDDDEEKRHADEILAILTEAVPYRRPDTAEYLDLAVARWRDYLGVGPLLPDRKAAAERSDEIHVALARRFRPYRAWMAREASR